MTELPPEDKALLSKIVDLGERRRRTSKRSIFTREQLVSAMNERYCWLDNEKAIFDLQNFVTRKRDQVQLDMSNLFAIEEVDGKDKTISAFSAWITSPERLHYAGRRFCPGSPPLVDRDMKGNPLGGTYINLWRGWGCEPAKGDVTPLLNLIARLCSFDQKEIDYLTWRLAIKIQKPWMKIPSYVLIVTNEEGTGKSQLVKFVIGLYGAHGKIITDREMESSFDDWKGAGILAAGAEEISFKEKRSVANRLKAIASMEVDHINPKGQPSYQVENFYDLLFTANHHDAIYIRNDRERRPFIVMHTPVTAMSKTERDELQSWYDNGGKAAMLHFLMHEVDGGAFDPYAPAPVTCGKTQMAVASRNPAEQFVAETQSDAEEDGTACPLKDFTALLKDYAGARTPDKRDEATLARALRAAGSVSRRFRFQNNRITLYPARDLAKWNSAADTDWITKRLGINMTIDLAMRFAALHGENFKYISGRWYEWDGNLWKKEETLKVLYLCRKICRAAGNGGLDPPQNPRDWPRLKPSQPPRG